MKVIGMYFIILGHFSSIGSKYIYVFNVPVFFVVSGFLSKREDTFSTFVRKIWWNLLVPTLIICVVYLLVVRGPQILANDDWALRLALYPFQLICGVQFTLGKCWFVYTLIVIKLLYQFLNKTSAHVLLMSVFALFTVIIRNRGYVCGSLDFYHNPNAIFNVGVSYPFFLFGVFLRKRNSFLTSKYSLPIYFFVLILSTVFIFICGTYNSTVFMYYGGYGDNFLLFLLGGAAGTVLVYVVSRVLERIDGEGLKLLSMGTIVMLGFQGYFIAFIRWMFPHASFLDFFFALVVTVVFIPIIKIFKSKFPFLLGIYRLRKNKTL